MRSRLCGVCQVEFVGWQWGEPGCGVSFLLSNVGSVRFEVAGVTSAGIYCMVVKQTS